MNRLEQMHFDAMKQGAAQARDEANRQREINRRVTSENVRLRRELADLRRRLPQETTTATSP